jgi:threonylcarbamoyladenosine tRNA methylthiotransferase MtaB
MPGTFHIMTFGCKVNQYDSQLIRDQLLSAGWTERPRSEEPDVVIVDTCTVTATADGKARRAVRRVARELPQCRIVVTGCMVDRDRDQFADLPGVWKVFNNTQKADIADALVAGDKEGTDNLIPPKAVQIPHGAAGPKELSCLSLFYRGISGFAGHTRAFVKAQDGCDAYCTYCIVPSVRGAPHSRPMAEVLDETRRLAEQFKEIVLTGIHIGLYQDESGSDLADLVRAVLEQTDVPRLRLSSIGPEEISPKLLDVAASTGRFCPHFHMPLQSGSDSVLKRMNRRYTAGQFLDTLCEIQQRLDRPAISSDVIVGFPGETDEEFAQTVAVCEAAGFSRTHIFPYSDRPGTPASRMPDKCASRVVKHRKKQLELVASQTALDYTRSFVGRTVEVLAETTRARSGKLTGYTPRYLRVIFDGPDELQGTLVPVQIISAGPDTLVGTPA